MKEIIELNKRILTEARDAIPKKFGHITINRPDDYPQERRRLPADLKAELVRLRSQLNVTIPEDFGYTVSFGDYHPGLSISFSDGAEHEWGFCFQANAERSIFDQLAEADWGAFRTEGMSRCQIFDDMRELVRSMDIELLPTEALREAFSDAVEAFEGTKGRKPTKTYLLKFREDEGITEEIFPSIKAFTWSLPDIMTVHYQVIAVISKGRPLTADQIDDLKGKALEELEFSPISQAKALGIF